MQTAMQELMSGVREALAIWFALVAIVVVAFGLVPVFIWRAARRDNPTRQGKPATRQGKLAAQQVKPAVQQGKRAAQQVNGAAQQGKRAAQQGKPAPKRRSLSGVDELSRYAGEVAVAARRATVMAERQHADWLAAQRTRDAAWRAYEHAEEAVRRLSRAAAFPIRQHPLTADERQARVRYLHRAASQAYDRGELSAAQLADALVHRNGWDPARHPFQQQMMLRQAARDRLLRAHREAAEMATRAAHAADIATAAKRSLDSEASDATARVRRARTTRPTTPAAKARTRRFRHALSAASGAA